jgi:DNA-binding phage protein
MPKLTESYRESLLESLKHADKAAEYLAACLQDDDPRVLLLAFRDVAEAWTFEREVTPSN